MIRSTRKAKIIATLGPASSSTEGFRKGDVVVITMGVPLEARGSTNLKRVHKLGTGVFYEIF